MTFTTNLINPLRSCIYIQLKPHVARTKHTGTRAPGSINGRCFITFLPLDTEEVHKVFLQYEIAVLVMKKTEKCYFENKK